METKIFSAHLLLKKRPNGIKSSSDINQEIKGETQEPYWKMECNGYGIKGNETRTTNGWLGKLP